MEGMPANPAVAKRRRRVNVGDSIIDDHLKKLLERLYVHQVTGDETAECEDNTNTDDTAAATHLSSSLHTASSHHVHHLHNTSDKQ